MVAPTRDDDVAMTSLLSNVAATTSHWDRDDLDVAICRLFLSHLKTHSVTLCRLFEDAEMTRVSRKVTVSHEHGTLDTASSPEMTQIPMLADVPAWQECINRNRLVQYPAENGPCVTHFPIPGERGVPGILAIEAPVSLSLDDMVLVRDILQIFKNHLAL
jgi:hypothetical protein